MASHESEDLQLRREEVDILNSIYIDELSVSNNKSGIAECIETVLHPATAGQADQQYVCLTLLLHIPEEYPNIEPTITIKNPRGISDEFVDSLKRSLEEHATENLGNQVLFSLIQHAKDSLTYNNTPSCDCAVCLTGFQEDDSFTKTECYHYFHISCLERYINVCSNDYTKEIAEIQESGGMPQQKPKELQIVCPVCRKPISYRSESHGKQVYVKPAEDESFVPDGSMKKWQQKMRKLYKKQEKQGGIIDVEAESNKFLLDISATVSAPLSTLTLNDDVNSIASKREQRDGRVHTGHSKSRRENYNKYGNISYRYGERWQSNKDQKPENRCKEGNVNASNVTCEEFIIDAKQLNPIKSNDGQEAKGNHTLHQPDINQSKEELNKNDLKLNHKDQLNVESEKEVKGSNNVNENLTQILLCVTDIEKGIESKQLDEGNESILKEKKRNEQGDVQENRKSPNCTNKEQIGEKNNYTTQDKKSGERELRNKGENNYAKDRRTYQKDGSAKTENEHHKPGTSTARNVHHKQGTSTARNVHHKQGTSTARNVHHRSGTTTRNPRHDRLGCATTRDQHPRSSGSTVESPRHHRSTGNQQHHKSSGSTTRENQHYVSGGTTTKGNQHHISRGATARENQHHVSVGTTARENQHRISGGTTANGNQHHVSGDTMICRNLSESSKKSKNLSESSKKRNDITLKEVSKTVHDISEQGESNKNVPCNQTVSKEGDDKPNNSKQLGGSQDIKKDGQSYSGHLRYRNRKHFQKNPDEDKTNRDFKNVDKSAEQQSTRQKGTKMSHLEFRTKGRVSNDEACSITDSKKAVVSKGASPIPPDFPLTNPPSGFKSKGNICPPPGFQL